MAFIDNEVASSVLLACGCDLTRLRGELVEFVDATTPLIPESESTLETQPTLGFQRVLQRAVFHIQSSGKGVVKPCLLYTSPSPRDRTRSRMPSSA